MKKVSDRMDHTIAYYDKNAVSFCLATRGAYMSFCRNKFLALLDLSTRNCPNSPSNHNIHILDACCGSGRDSKAFLEAGYEVTSMDASEKICQEAGKFLGRKVLHMSFEEMEFYRQFDGIWACASLLHIPGEAISKVLLRCRRALKQHGVLYASMKYGQGERVEGGRFFRYYMEEEIGQLMAGSGFAVAELFVTKDVRVGREGERWMNVLANAAE